MTGNKEWTDIRNTAGKCEIRVASHRARHWESAQNVPVLARSPYCSGGHQAPDRRLLGTPVTAGSVKEWIFCETFKTEWMLNLAYVK